jgi:hypothetical protein
MNDMYLSARKQFDVEKGGLESGAREKWGQPSFTGRSPRPDIVRWVKDWASSAPRYPDTGQLSARLE